MANNVKQRRSNEYHPRINACSARSTNSESSRDHRVSSRFCSHQWKSVPVSLDVPDNNLASYNILQRPTTTNRIPVNRSTHAHLVLPFRSTSTNNEIDHTVTRIVIRITYHAFTPSIDQDRSGTIKKRRRQGDCGKPKHRSQNTKPWNQQCPTQTVVITEMITDLTIDPSRLITRTNAQKRNTFTCDRLIRFAVRPCRHDRPLRRRRPAPFVRRRPRVRVYLCRSRTTNLNRLRKECVLLPSLVAE